MGKQIGQWRTPGFFWPEWCKAGCGNSPLIRCASTQLHLRQHTPGRRQTCFWGECKAFLHISFLLQELWSGGWLCASSSDKANERKSKQRGGEGIQQGVCLQPERAASTGLGDEIRFSIRETCLSIVPKPPRRLKGAGICTWVSTSGGEHGVMNYSQIISLCSGIPLYS